MEKTFWQTKVRGIKRLLRHRRKRSFIKIVRRSPQILGDLCFESKSRLTLRTLKGETLSHNCNKLNPKSGTTVAL